MRGAMFKSEFILEAKGMLHCSLDSEVAAEAPPVHCCIPSQPWSWQPARGSQSHGVAIDSQSHGVAIDMDWLHLSGCSCLFSSLYLLLGPFQHLARMFFRILASGVSRLKILFCQSQDSRHSSVCIKVLERGFTVEGVRGCTVKAPMGTILIV